MQIRVILRTFACYPRRGENARNPLCRAICEHLRAPVKICPKRFRNEQVVSSILTTSSIPQSLMYQGVAAFLCLEKLNPKPVDFCVCCHFVATCCHLCRVARMSRLAVFEIGINSVRKRQKYSCQIGNRFGRSCQNGDGMQRQRIV